MNNKMLVFVVICTAQVAFGMEDQRDYPQLTQEEQSKVNNALMSAIERGSIKQVREAIQNGANANFNGEAPLLAAVKKVANYHIVEILLASGADVNQRVLQVAEGAGWCKGHLDILLAHIPVSEQEKIRARIPGLREGSLGILRGEPQPPLDIRKKIKQILVDDLVQEQMQRIIKLVGEVKSLGYLSDQLNYTAEPYENLRKRVRNNIMRILYGEPIQRKK